MRFISPIETATEYFFGLKLKGLPFQFYSFSMGGKPFIQLCLIIVMIICLSFPRSGGFFYSVGKISNSVLLSNE